MKMRLIIVVVFLIAMASGVADAKWDPYPGEPQPFQIFDDYVIAVGTPDKREPVQASDIEKALQNGKEIRLRFAEIQGNIMFRSEVEQNVYFMFARFTRDTDFRFATFTGDVNFLYALENILYNEVFYLTLIKKYKEQGWLDYADYVYYDYLHYQLTCYTDLRIPM